MMRIGMVCGNLEMKHGRRNPNNHIKHQGNIGTWSFISGAWMNNHEDSNSSIFMLLLQTSIAMETMTHLVRWFSFSKWWFSITSNEISANWWHIPLCIYIYTIKSSSNRHEKAMKSRLNHHEISLKTHSMVQEMQRFSPSGATAELLDLAPLSVYLDGDGAHSR